MEKLQLEKRQMTRLCFKFHMHFIKILIYDNNSNLIQCTLYYFKIEWRNLMNYEFCRKFSNDKYDDKNIFGELTNTCFIYFETDIKLKISKL